MPDFVVNENKFMLNMDDDHDRYLHEGEILPNGMVVSEVLEYSHLWQIYITDDGNHNILAVDSALAQRWVDEMYLPRRAFADYFLHGREISLLFSPSSIILHAVNQIKFHNSLRYAFSFACGMFNSRIINQQINLRDGIYCELYSVILPSYSRARPVADRAIFQNAIGATPKENILSPQEMDEPGVSYFTVLKELGHAGYKLPGVEPYLQTGEEVDEFISTGEKMHICGAVALHEKYQIYHTNSDILILIMENSYANELIEHELIAQMDLASIQAGGGVLRALAFTKRFALDALDDRHFGFTKEGSFFFAQAVRRTRLKVPQARFDNALYLEKAGKILPVEFEGNTLSDGQLVEKILTQGPFASSAFLEDHIHDCSMIAQN